MMVTVHLYNERQEELMDTITATSQIAPFAAHPPAQHAFNNHIPIIHRYRHSH